VLPAAEFTRQENRKSHNEKSFRSDIKIIFDMLLANCGGGGRAKLWAMELAKEFSLV
jgi:hypothetical protein